MVKPQEVETIRPVTDVQDPTLVRVHLEMKGLGRPLEPCVGLLCVGLGPAQDRKVICVADDLAEVACFFRPESIEGVAVDVAQERRYRSALGYPGHATDTPSSSTPAFSHNRISRSTLRSLTRRTTNL